MIKSKTCRRGRSAARNFRTRNQATCNPLVYIGLGLVPYELKQSQIGHDLLWSGAIPNLNFGGRTAS